MSKSESDLLKIDGIGRKAVNRIKEEFNKINKAIKTDYYIGKRKCLKKAF
jgi:DNA-directed RNA polymerase alpha subunit